MIRWPSPAFVHERGRRRPARLTLASDEKQLASAPTAQTIARGARQSRQPLSRKRRLTPGSGHLVASGRPSRNPPAAAGDRGTVGGGPAGAPESDGSRDEAILQEGAGFGGGASTWLQQHPMTFTCDGKWHTQKFVIDKTEVGPDGQPIGRGQLVKGWAYVQLCLIKGGSETEEPEVFLADQEWRKVG